MLYINHLTNDPQQQANLTGIPGISIGFSLRFMPRIKRWIVGVSSGATSIQGIAVTTSPNMLRQFKNIIPFGIACVTPSGLDPFTVDDFASQASNLYLLNSSDVEEIEGAFFT